MAAKLKKGDPVIVLTGRDKGRKGEILKVFPKEFRALVRGVGIVTQHRKPTRANEEGQLIRKEAPIHLSNLAFVDPKTSQPTRVGFKTLDDGRKVRFAKLSGDLIDG